MPPKSTKGKKAAAAPASEAPAAPAPAAPAPVVETPPAPAPAAPAPAAPAPKKGKKQTKVVAVVTPEGIEGSFLPEPRRPLIAHLQIKTSEVVFYDQPLAYDPNPPAQPEPYDPSQMDVFSTQQELLDTQKGVVDLGGGSTPRSEMASVSAATEAPVVAPAQPAVASKAMPCFTKSELMVQYRNTHDAKRLPDTTEIACFWCAHTFNWAPCVIPEREVHGVYNVYGNFCSPNCGVAYLLGETIDPHVRWERMALLHRVYDQEGRGRIFPAPARESLQLFGGPMSIDTFRATSTEGRVRVDLHMPPMVSILGSIDTKPIDFFDVPGRSGSGNGAVLPSSEKIARAEEGLRLKRSKPLKDRESTLDSLMSIQVGRGR
jgi:hypothetical protein